MIVGGQGFRPRIAVVDGLATRALPRKLVLSGHSAQMHQGGGSSFTPWYVATELSWAAGLEKTEALAAVLPWCWEEIVGGNERWGSARSVDLVWQKIRAAVPSTLPRHAPEGLTELLAQWGVTGTAPIEVEVAPPPLARRVVSRWGEHGGYVGRLTEGDVEDVLSAVVQRREPVPRAGG